MLDILLTGVGGQGTVLAAKVLAQTAQDKGWKVRTGETIGMAQRGGSVISHVRMGDKGEQLYSSLLAHQSADLIIAFEPAEAVRVLPYLASDGMLITARTGVQPVTATLSDTPYNPEEMIAYLDSLLNGSGSEEEAPCRFFPVEDTVILTNIGTRKTLNMILLASALEKADIGITVDDLIDAVKALVKKEYIDLNLKAIESAVNVTRNC